MKSLYRQINRFLMLAAVLLLAGVPSFAAETVFHFGKMGSGPGHKYVGFCEIRSETPAKGRLGTRMRLGRLDQEKVGTMRTLLQWPVSEELAGRDITSAQLVLTIQHAHSRSTPIRLFVIEAQERLPLYATSWTERSPGRAWESAGGDSEATPVAEATVPANAEDGATVTFGSTPALVKALSKAVAANQPLQILLKAPELEQRGGGFVRFYSPKVDTAGNRPLLKVTATGEAKDRDAEAATQQKAATPLTGDTIVIRANQFQFPGDWVLRKDRGKGWLLWARQAYSDALAVFELAEGGTWEAWTLARDFADNPGARRYKLHIDSVPADEESGDHGQLDSSQRHGWYWEHVATRELDAGEHVLALHDTSHYFPRCAAVLLTRSGVDPNQVDDEKLFALTQPLPEVATSRPPIDFPEDPDPLRAPVRSMEKARIETDAMRVRFCRETGADGTSRLVRKTDLRLQGNWVTLPLPSEEEKLFVLQAPDVLYNGRNYFPAWPKTTQSKLVFTAAGRQYEVPDDHRNPFLAAATEGLTPVSCEQQGPGRVEIVYRSEDGTEAVAHWEKGAGSKDVRCRVAFTPDADGYASIGYSGFRNWTRDEADYVFLPPLHQYQRLPDSPVMIINGTTPHPVAFVQDHLPGVTGSVSLGVAADPAHIPFQWPNMNVSQYGLSLLDENGDVQPSIFHPVLGQKESRVRKGVPLEVSWHVVALPGAWRDALDYCSETIYDVTDYRKPYPCSLTEAAINQIELVKDDFGSGWDPRYKAFYYVEGPQQVTQSAPLAVLSAALLSQDEELYRTRGLPSIEYCLTRGGLHFVWGSRKGRRPSQHDIVVPSPVWPATFWQGAYALTGRLNPWMADLAREAFENVKAGKTGTWGDNVWNELLALYRLDPTPERYKTLVAEARRFAEKDVFGEKSRFLGIKPHYNVVFYPAWWQLPDMFSLTGDALFKRAAAEGGFHTVAGMWSQPTIPDREVTIHPEGKYGSYDAETAMRWRDDEKFRVGFPRQEGDSPEQQVPAWLVSQVGLGFEQPGTYFGGIDQGFKNTMICQQAPHLLRLYGLTGREIFRTYARNNIIGRFGNYPGYYITGFTTIHMQERYPYDGPAITSIYNTHIPVHLASTLDFLMAEVEVRSEGNITFPYAIQRGYAQFNNRVYGGAAGTVYGDDDAWPVLRRGLVKLDDKDITYLTARSRERFYLILMNEVETPKTVTPELDAAEIGLADGGTIQVYDADGESRSVPADASVDVPPQGIRTLAFDAKPRRVRPELPPLKAKPVMQEVNDVWGTCHAYRIRSPFGSDSLYVVFTGEPPEDAVATLRLEGDSAGKRTKDFYPYEFTVYPWPMGDDMQISVECRTAGETQRVEMTLPGNDNAK